MRTLHRLPIAIFLLALAVAASGCSAGTPTESASAARARGHFSESVPAGAGDATLQESNTAPDSGSTARDGGGLFGSGN